MPNPLARLFSGGTSGKLETFPALVSLLAHAWNPAYAFAVREVGEGDPPPDGEARLLCRGGDRPAAAVIGPAGETAALDALASLTVAALLATDRSAGPPGVDPADATSANPEYRDYRGYASEPAGWFLLFDDRFQEDFRSLLASRGPKDTYAAAAAAFSPEAPSAAATPAEGRLLVTEPRAACASRLLFPAAVQAGETAIRFTPRALGLGSAETGDEDEAWFRFGLKTETASLGGFWALRRPDAVPAERFPSLAASVAKAAGGALAAEYAVLGLAEQVSSAAAPAPAPNLGGAATFILEGTVAVGPAVMELRAVVPPALPLKLASLGGLEAAEALTAMLALDRRLFPRLDSRSIDSRALLYGSEAVGGRAAEGYRFIPFYEALGVLSESDYRKLAQNFLVRRYHREELAELFFYRKTIMADGAPKRVVVRPQAFDLNRFVGLLPEAVRASFIAAVKEGASAATADDFVLRNEGLYEAAIADLRRGGLELGFRARELIGDVYARYVYPRKRKRLDAMIEADYPFALLRSLPPRQFRSVVDGCDFRTIAAALVGRPEALEEIARWCSARKLANIRGELDRLSSLLDAGAADADGLCSLRAAMARKADEIKERERRERID